MKKILLSALLSAFVLGNVFAQFSLNTNTNIGQVYKNVIATDKDTFLVNFNTAIVNSTWINSTATPSVLTITYKKCQTQKGLQVLAYPDATTTTAYGFGSSDCNNYGAQRNPIHVASLDSLKSIMNHSVLAASLGALGSGGNANDSLSRPAACLFDKTATDQAFGMYPGKCKRIEYAFQLDFTGRQVTDDITFDIDTYNAGTTGKTASYELAVYNGTTITDANLIGSKVAGIYVTGSGLKTINLASAIGKSPSEFNNKKICIFLRTLGTSNASGVVDGIRNEVDPTTKVPLQIDPTIIIDNLNATFQNPYWTVPAGANPSAYINFNNGSPAVTNSADLTYGTAVPVIVAVDNQIKFNLKGVNRYTTVTIAENTHNSFFSVPANGINANDGNGNYNVPVAFTTTQNTTTLNYTYTIAAPTTPPVSDDIQITLIVNKPTVGNVINRYEINNGTRFWYNFSATASIATEVQSATEHDLVIFSANKTIVASNATADVAIFNIAGQKVKVVSALDAAKGIFVKAGLYIVKTGSTVQKVLVR